MRSRLVRSRLAAAAAVTVIVATSAGCGVSPAAPEDRGDGLQAVAPVGDQIRAVPQPTAGNSETLVSDFLKSTVGGGEPAVAQAEAFLTPPAKDAWNPQNPDDLTVIHIVGGPAEGVGASGRVPVTVDYQVVGQLTGSGRVDELSRPAGGQMTFWVVRDPDNPSGLRIDEVQNAPGGLLISDLALTDIYRIQPVYFWDTNYQQLIPDLRYLPLTLSETDRANRLVQWVQQGPSPWLIPPARVLPSGVAPQNVVIREGKYVVNLTVEATAGGQEAFDRLLRQLQWSLANGANYRPVELQLDGKTQAGPDGSEAFRPFNQSWYYREVMPRYDIVDPEKRVVAAGGSAPAVLASPDNKEVHRAAVSRDRTVVALVRLRPNGQRYLQIVRADAPTLPVDLASLDMGRPSFVSGADNGFVVVTALGRLYVVSTRDGSAHAITPARVDDVSTAVVSPDGRRIAFVADGQAYVSSLVVDGETLTVGSNPRPILADRVSATAIAWLNETWLNVGGTAGGAPAMWEVTADGVVARDESADLRGLTVTDIVAGTRWPSSEYSDVIIYTPAAPYLFGTSPTQITEQSPFFGG